MVKPHSSIQSGVGLQPILVIEEMERRDYCQVNELADMFQTGGNIVVTTYRARTRGGNSLGHLYPKPQ